MILPLHNPEHFLYGKTFNEQCNLIINSSDVYELFGISAYASKREIIRIYQHLALRFHPDHHQDACELANKAMQKINDAKSYLEAPNANQSASTARTSFPPVYSRLLEEISERRKNTLPLADESISLAEATEDDLLLRVHWQRIQNDSIPFGHNMILEKTLIAEIKRRIENGSFSLYYAKLPDYGETLLQLLARSQEVEFFSWLLENAPDLDALLKEQDNRGLNCICHCLRNLNSEAGKKIFNLIQKKLKSDFFQEDLDYVLRIANIQDEVLELIIEHLPTSYFDENLISIAEENPTFLRHLKRFVSSHTREKLIKKAIYNDPACYKFLSKEDKGRIDYIILTFFRQSGRSQQNADNLPFKQLPFGFIKALTQAWPDLELKLQKTYTGFQLEPNNRCGNLYSRIKNSWQYKLGELPIRLLAPLNFFLILSFALSLTSKHIVFFNSVVPATLAAVALLLLAYSVYQRINTHLYAEKIRLFNPDNLKDEGTAVKEIIQRVSANH